MAEGHGWGGASRTDFNHPASAPSLSKREAFFSYLCRRVITCAFRSQWLEDSRCAFNVGARSLYRVWLLVWRRVVVFLPALYGFYYAEN